MEWTQEILAARFSKKCALVQCVKKRGQMADFEPRSDDERRAPISFVGWLEESLIYKGAKTDLVVMDTRDESLSDADKKRPARSSIRAGSSFEAGRRTGHDH